MAHVHQPSRRGTARRQRGMTLIEFMVTITIGMIMVAALATLIADQSGNRAEVDRAGRMIENGRYGIRAMTDDLQLAGYWGELNGPPQTTTPDLPGVCDAPTPAKVMEATRFHVQGLDGSTTVPSCLPDYLANTDVLVVRHADPDTSSLETTPGTVDFAKLTNKIYYVQTGLNSSGSAFTSLVGISVDQTTDAAAFNLMKKDKTTPAKVRRVVARIYYVARCSVQASGSCDSGDGGNPIPTLKMRELGIDSSGNAGWTTPVTIAEGIENMQVDYGVDSNGDGSVEVLAGANTDASSGYASASYIAASSGVGNEPKDVWQNVLAVKIHLLARSLETSPGHTDDKTYSLGSGGVVTPTQTGYKRHVFVQSVRLVNPSARRTS